MHQRPWLSRRVMAVAAVTSLAVVVTSTPAMAAADRTAPTDVAVRVTELTSPAQQHTVGGTTYLNPRHAGSFTLTVAATDRESGVASVTFPKMLGMGAWRDTTAPFARTYTWAPSVTSPGAVTVLATNNAGKSTTGQLQVRADATQPASGAVVRHAVGAQPTTDLTIATTAGPGDNGSGVASRTLLRHDSRAADGCVATDTAQVPEDGAGLYTDRTLERQHCYSYSLVETDHVGNARTTPGPGRVTVTPAPVATALALTTQEDTSLPVRLSGAALAATVVDPPSHGTLSGSGEAMTYTPLRDYDGQDTFQYTLSDGTLTSSTAEVRISVAPVNDVPVARGSTLTVPAGSSGVVSLAADDVDGDALTYSVVAGPASGQVSGTGQDLTYAPAPGFSGTDAFSFIARDGVSTSAPATVVVTVEPGVTKPAPSAGRWHLTAAYQQEQPASQHGGSVTDAVAVQQARAFDLLTVQSKSVSGATGTTPPTKVVPIYTRANIAAMRAANPRFRIAPYINGGTTGNPNHPESWYAHNALGGRVVNTDWGTRYVMQPDNEQWKAYLRDYALVVHASSDYDDLFIDVLGDYPIGLGPVKPGSVTAYSAAEWYGMTKGVAAAVQAALPTGARAIPNGLAHGAKYPMSKALLTGADSAMAEIFTRTATSPYTSPTTGLDVQTRTLAAWQAELKMIEDMGATGKVGTLMVKDWTGDSSAEERIKYGFATALLATNGTHYLGVSLGQATTMRTYSWLSGTDYGTPLGSYTVNSGGLYQREFSRATVAVNPTDKTWTGQVRGQVIDIPARRAALVVDPA